MKCKECPVFGHSHYQMTKKPLCFASCHPTTEVKSPEAECQYGIVDYKEYIKKIWENGQDVFKKGEKQP